MYSYWTDNGACYYYDTGNYSNYEEILDAVIADADRAKIPFRYLQVYTQTLLCTGTYMCAQFYVLVLTSVHYNPPD